MLESEIAALTARGIDVESLAQLETATEEMQRGWDLGDLVTNVEADLRFHQIIVGHCGNRMLQLLYESAAEILTETQRQPIPATRTERMQASIAEHRAVISALRARDPEGARAAMAAHIRNTALSAAVDLD